MNENNFSIPDEAFEALSGFSAAQQIEPDRNRIIAQIREGMGSQAAVSGYRVKSWTRWAAGALTAVVVMSALVFYFHNSADNKQLSKYRSYSTTTGQRARITLDDGSTVTLAPGSRIEYVNEFGKSARDVSLEGEAMFVVAHSTGLPFVVKTGKVKTRVLGTTFTISRYLQDSAVRVVVAEGKVAVNDKIVSTGDVARARDAGITVEHAGDVTPYLAWVSGDVYWKSASADEIKAFMQRWYGLDVMIPQRNASNHFTATFRNPTSAELLSYLSGVLGARFERRGNQILFQ